MDTLSWEFSVLTIDDSNITGPPKDGAYIKGLYLEGAGWDKKNSVLVEAEPMQLVSGMPSIHFKPVENKRKSGKGEQCSVLSCNFLFMLSITFLAFFPIPTSRCVFLILARKDCIVSLDKIERFLELCSTRHDSMAIYFVMEMFLPGFFFLKKMNC